MPPCSRNWAFFLDVDGTLLDIAETPDAAEATRSEKSLVRRLHEASGGALALVSGRSLAAIDELFAPLKIAAAGQHGVERRDSLGQLHRGSYPRNRLQRAAQAVRDFAAALHVALTMSPEEQRTRLRSMRHLVQEFNVYRWAGRMLVDAARMRHRKRVLARVASGARRASL